VEKWRIYTYETAVMELIGGQPDDGFAGPGVAFTWLRENHAELYDRLGADVLIVRDDGARPMTNTRGGARPYVGHQAVPEPSRHVKRRPELLGAQRTLDAAPAGPVH
jgi:hypothetical protein